MNESGKRQMNERMMKERREGREKTRKRERRNKNEDWKDPMTNGSLKEVTGENENDIMEVRS